MVYTKASYTLLAALPGGFVLITSVFAFSAEAHTESARITKATSTAERGNKNVDLSCVQTAVDTREDALSEAFIAFSESITTALEARKTALHDAWGLSDKNTRNRAIVAAWKEWRTDSKAAYKEIRTERKAAWDTFRKTMKSSCRTEVPKDEALGKDATGEVAL